MGCCVSKVEKQETVCRCKSRKRYLKHFLHARHSLSSAHSLYLHSLRSTGAALLHFSTSLHHHHHHHLPPLPPSPPRLPSTLPPPPPPPPPPMSPSTDTWTTTSTTTSSANPQPHPPPPPPPPPGAGSTWDFWDPFAASPAPATRSGTEEEWEDATTESAVREVGAAASVSGVSKETEEMAVVAVAARQGKDIVEIMKELEEYFVKAAEGGSHVSCLLEVPHFSTLSSPFQSTPGNKVYNYGRSWSPMQWSQWGSTAKSNGYAKFGGQGVGNVIPVGNRGINVNGNPTTASSHCSTVERLYAWEKKLFLEVKSAETIRAEQEKKGEQVRKLEVKKKADYIKIEKAKKEVEKLESQLEVASQAIQSTSFEIIKLRETQLYPQLLLLVNGLMCMWRSMYECHQVQMHIVDQLKYLNTFSPSTEPTSELHRQSTLQLELELQQWHHSFVNLVKAQRSYVQSLTGWLRLSLFEFNKNRSSQDSSIYSLCEEWQQAIEHVPDKVAAEGIKSLLTVVHAIVVQQGEEQKQKKKSEAANKELEKRAAQLRALEGKYGPYSTSRSTKGRDPVEEKRAKVAALKVKAEEEKGKHEKAVSVTRAMTLNNLQMGLPHVFQAITGFSSVCMRGYESVYNMAKIMEQQQRQQQLQPEVKMLMPPSDVRSYR